MSSITTSPTESLESLPASIVGEEKKNEKLKITLNHPNNIYYSGQTVRGTISVTTKHPKKIRGIYFQIVGYGKCGWTDVLKRDGYGGERSAVRRYSDSESYMNSTVYVIGEKNGPSFTLSEGITVYDFSFQLKHRLPSTFSGAYGKIKYKIIFVIDRPWKLDEKQQVPLTIIQLFDFTCGSDLLKASGPLSRSSFEHHFLKAIEENISRTIGYLASGPVTLHVLIPKSYYVPLEKIPIEVIVTNNSRISIDKLKFSIVKTVDYTMAKYAGIFDAKNKKTEILKMTKKEAGGVNKKTEQRYQHSMEIPDTIPTQLVGVSKLIRITYKLTIEAKLSGLYKNVMVQLPIIIGNVPEDSTEALPLPSTSTPVIVPRGPPYALEQEIAGGGLRPIGFNFNRMSLSSNSSIRIIAPVSPGNSTATDSNSIANISPVSTISQASRSLQISMASSSTASSSQIQPSAPPIEFGSMNLSSASVHSDVTISTNYDMPPPSYEEVFGSPSTSHNATRLHSSPTVATAGKT